EGESVRLSFNYTGVVNSFQWHRQNPGKGLEYILLIDDSGITTKADSSDLQFCAEADKENKRVELKLSSTKMTDTALYYCTLSPTVTGISYQHSAQTDSTWEWHRVTQLRSGLNRGVTDGSMCWNPLLSNQHGQRYTASILQCV
ncbi:UNVERIFIED_CONTAM: hypothetical protein FKN15_047669, partial [Acipenser sinensis]